MIVIDKSDENQTILLTLDGIADHSGLLLQKDDTRERFEIDLLENASLFNRYDRYVIPTVAFSGMDEGYYSYWVRNNNNEIIESGKLFIVPDAPVTIPTATAAISEDILIFTK